MAEMLSGWSPEVERSFKKVLYRFLEEVHCTKAALYLLAPDGSWVLASHYGFGRRHSPPASYGAGDSLSEKVAALDEPAAAGLPTDASGETSKENASLSRVVLAPLMSGGRTVGFVDARDKGGGRPFDVADVRQAGLIAGALAKLARRHGIGAVAVETSRDEESNEIEHRSWGELVGEEGDRHLDETGVERLKEAMVDALGRDRVYAVAATAVDGDAAATFVCAGAGAGEVDTDTLTRHQGGALTSAGVAAPHPAGWKVLLHRLPALSEVVRPSVLATAVPRHGARSGLVLSVVGGEGSTPPAVVLERLQRVVEDASERSALGFERRALARRLLQPGERSFPDLVAHSQAVSRLCWSLARALGFDRVEAGEAALAGLLHDVGMRELEYERLYRHPSPSPKDRLLYRQHVVVGERILGDTGLDGISRATRHHHERWDGKGYPDRLAGSAIPYLARLVSVAEVFDVLTSSSSYRPPLPTQRALATMRAAAGQQLDPELVALLAQVVG